MRGDNLANSFLGDIDEVSIYNRALTAGEIQSIFNAGSAGKCNDLPPLIISQPAGQTVPAGTNVTFSVSASGSAPLSYQWLLNSNNLPGATNATLTLTNVQPVNDGNYSVIVSNPFGTVTSSNALLTVNPIVSCIPPFSGLVSWWPGEGNGNDIAGGNNGVAQGNVTFVAGKVGQAFNFDGNDGTAVVVGNPASLQLQNFTIECWFRRTDTNRVSIPTTSGGFFGYGAGGYIIGLDNAGTPFLSQYGFSNVQGGAPITDLNFHHLAVTKNGTTVVFFVDGVESAITNYSVVFTFTTSASLGGADSGLNHCFLGVVDEVSVYNRALGTGEVQAIFNAGSAGKCNEVTPTITTQPAGQTVPAGTNVIFSVTASGSAPLGYQWQLNNNNVPGATNATLTLTNVQPANAGNYLVIVSNAFGKATSSNAMLTVTPPVISCTPAPSGLVSWWPGEGNGNDIAGGNNGTLKGNTTFAPGEVNQAFVFDGNGDGVVVGNPTNLQLQNFTIEAWVKRNSTNQASLNAGGGVVFSYGHAGYAFFLAGQWNGRFGRDRGQFCARRPEDNGPGLSSRGGDQEREQRGVLRGRSGRCGTGV